MHRALRTAVFVVALTACGGRAPSAPPDAGPPADPPSFARIDFAPGAQLFAKYEITFTLDKQLDSPFDPREANLVAVFTDPNGAPTTVPAFWYQDFDRGTDPVSGRDTFAAKGDPVWKVRFAPSVVGDWSFRLVIPDAKGAVESEPRTFTVTKSNLHGFVRQGVNDAHWFVFDDGTPFFGLGENLAWGDPSVYESHLARLAKAGGNFLRMWMTGFDNYDLEWKQGIGQYDLSAAYKLDQVLEIAEANGIEVMLCLMDHGKFSLYVNGEYQDSPYRMSRGGPLPDDDPNAVWSSAEAKAAMQRLFRYLIARYGYSTALHSWEFWNEMEWVGAKEGDFALHQGEATMWHREMAAFFRANDPFRHLITTSHANAFMYEGDVFDSLDFAQTHLYTATKPPIDPALAVRETSTGMQSLLGQPMMIGEYGITLPTDQTFTPAQKAEAVHRSDHAILWSSMVARAASGALTWDWETMDSADLYSVYSGLSAFASSEPFAQEGLVSVRATASSASLGQPTSASRVAPGYYFFDSLAPANDFTLDEDGALTPDSSALHRYLFASGDGHHNPPTFRVAYEAAGRLDVTVATVSSYGTAKLTILLDGVASSVNGTVVTAGATVGTVVPSGNHTIVIDSAGSDWLEVQSYLFSWPRSSLRARVLRSDRRVIGWVENLDGSLTLDRLGAVPPPVNDGVVSIDRVLDGDWKIDWWDTEAGKVVGSTQATAQNGVLQVTAPSFSFDIAFKAARE